jgi:hypothetical protein
VAPAPVALQLKPEDAGVKLPPTPSAVPGGGGGHAGGGLGPCCAALIQNSQSAAPPMSMYMLQAGQMCQALAGQGMGKQAVGQFLGMLRGAGIPAQCR